ncbi:uncharacterized protein [Typha angustifolia]|uniref:uncharacterized protein n=1 Tax=Typha angustifolia TaxID=59011 RepID=UPI003C2BBD9B
MASLVSSTTSSTFFRRNPKPNPEINPTLLFSPSLRLPLPRPRPLHLRLKPSPSSFKTLGVRASSSSLSTPPSPPSSLFSSSTATLSSLLALVVSASRALLSRIAAAAAAAAPSASELAELRSLRGNLACAVGPLFFAALRNRPSGYLNTPLTVVASGMAKWLDIYSGVLMVRVLLSWFPNIPWDRQPLSAIRDLCDPYLNLFRNIIPPVFDTLDVSPLLAFAVLGTLSSILNNSRGMY